MTGRDGPPDDGHRTPPDPERFGRALESCRPYLLGVANRELRADLIAKAGASDLVQETFLEAQRDFGRFQGQTDVELRAWLRRILLNNLANFVRRYREPQKRKVSREVSIDQQTTGGHHPESLAASTLSPSGHAMRNEQAVAVTQALRRLRERDRQVVLWRYQEDCSFEEIGRRLGGSAEMARKVWNRAIERIRSDVGSLPF
jgi:RNA polymerase sigma-70 factor (ECF subfamily)